MQKEEEKEKESTKQYLSPRLSVNAHFHLFLCFSVFQCVLYMDSILRICGWRKRGCGMRRNDVSYLGLNRDVNAGISITW
jgi:hypothetical protein